MLACVCMFAKIDMLKTEMLFRRVNFTTCTFSS